jgi:hypothetical protein
MINGCTIGANRNISDTAYCQNDVSVPQVSNKIFNSVIFGSVLERDSLEVSRCIVAGTIADNQLKDKSRRMSADNLKFDAEWRPEIGSNEAVDFANEQYYDSQIAGGCDIYGSQRIYNGAMDAGAVEADWRARYGRALGRCVNVFKADPFVVLADDQKVSIINGVLSLEMTNYASGGLSTYSFAASVSGSGTLEIYLADNLFATLTASDEAEEFSFLSAEAVNSLKFAYIPGEGGEGAAYLSSFTRSKGLRLMIR